MNSKYADSLVTFKNSKPDEIPPFPQEAVQAAIDEINQNYNEIREMNKKKTENPNLDADSLIYLKGKMVIKIDSIFRLKRFLLLAHEARCQRIEEQFWRYGGEVKKSQLPHMADQQKSFLLNYKSILNNYIENVGLELTMDMDPPLDTMIHVKVLRDCGEIVDEGNVSIMERNSVHYVKRKLVEKFIQRGDMVVIE